MRSHDFRQQNNAERLAGVALESRSRADFWCLRARGPERLWCVAPTGRSGSGATLVGRSERSLQGHLRLFGVTRTRATSWRRFRRSLREVCEMRATSARRSGQVASLGEYGEWLHGVAPARSLWEVLWSDLMTSLRNLAPILCSSSDHLFHLLWAPNASKCPQELHVALQHLIKTHVCKM